MRSERVKLVAITLLALGFSSVVAADWRMNPVDDPFSLNKTGVNTSTVQFVSIEFKDPETGNWNPVTPSNLQDGDMDNLNFYYNESSNSSKLDYYYGSYWYADFSPNMTRGDALHFNASGTVNDDGNNVASNGVVNVTEDIQVGDYNMSLLTDIPGEVKPGKEISLEVQVTNSSSGDYLNNSDINVWAYFANASWKSTQYDLGNYDSSGDFFYNDRVQYPSDPGSKYVLHIKGNSSSGNRSHGTYSQLLSTAPAIKGFIDDFNASSGCSNRTNVAKCEAGANISYSYNITNSNAQGVNLTVYGFNSSGKYELLVDQLTDSSSGYFTGEVEIPDLNTSTYKKEMQFVFNASNQERFHVDKWNVTYKSFIVDDRSDANTYTGSEHAIELLFAKPYSGDPYNKSRFGEINATVTNSEGREIADLARGDFSYDSSRGLLSSTIFIQSDAPTGTYELDVEAENIYGEQKSFKSFSFNVLDLEATFTAEDEATFSVNRLVEQRYFIDVENLIDSTNELEYDIDSLPENVELVNDTIQLQASEQDVLAFDINLTSLEDESGNLTLMDADTNYNETVQIQIDAADCQIQRGDLCSETGELSLTATGTEQIEDSITLRNVGPSNETIDFNVSLTGDVSQFMEVEGEKENLTLDDHKEINLNFNPRTEGTFEGDVVFNTESGTELEVPVSLEVDPSQSSGSGTGGSTENNSTSEGPQASDISITPSTITLGSVYPGSTPSATLQITNDAGEPISPVAVTSSDFGISTTAVESVPAGETRRVVVTFNSMNQGNGQIQAIAGPKEKSISVTADLQSSTGNQSSQEPGQGGDSQSSDDTDNTSSNQRSSGLPIIPIAAGIIVFLVIAFVFFTSYVPEEGDPLYDVLGEGQ